MRLTFTKALLTTVLFGLGSLTASAQSLTIKLGHVGEPGSLFAQSAEAFAEKANQKLGDKAEVKVFGSSQLGSDSELLKKLKLGTVDLALPSTIMSSVDPSFALFEMPYLVKDRDHMARIRDEIVRSTLYPAAEKRGYRVLGVWENGFRHITNNAKPINKVADLQGIKLRVPKGVWRVKMFEAYGASPSPMAFSEVFVALQTGVMDGQENPLAQIYPSRLYEVQDYLSLSGHVYTPAYLIAGASWKRFPEEVQQALEQAAVEMEPEVAEIAASLDEELLAKLKDAGIAINEVDRQDFIDNSQSIYSQFAEEVDGGQAMLDQAKSLAQD